MPLTPEPHHAGVEEDSKASQAQQWMKQIERNMERPGGSSSSSAARQQQRHGGGSSGLGSQYVEVVGYEHTASSAPPMSSHAVGSYGSGGDGGYGASGSSYGNGGGYGGGSSGINYGQISGERCVGRGVTAFVHLSSLAGNAA